MDLPSFVHLRTHVWKLLRDQHGGEDALIDQPTHRPQPRNPKETRP